MAIQRLEESYGKYNDLKDKKSLVRVVQDGNSVTGQYTFGIDFLVSDCPKLPVIQRVVATNMYYNPINREDATLRLTKLTIEGWPIVATAAGQGVSNMIDTHSSDKLSTVGADTKVVRQVKLAIGFGGFRKPGGTAFEAVTMPAQSLYTDFEIGAKAVNLVPVHWLGNVLEYTITFEFTGKGDWSLKAVGANNKTILDEAYSPRRGG